ncbi:ABC transporter permease subunit [Streptomyces sp. NBC_00838]|uniref:ABC transporter permease n=1 Tax=Streptomyces sp. NBC_00838 TaxID=2903680 RepID=UPI00386DC6B0|nr:ABC transporter permease subunit [Streptomyces sp. NBC_00838]
MSAPTVTPYRSQLPPARDGFPQLLHAEWTKLRTVPRWGLTLLATVVITVLISLLSAFSGGSDVSGDRPPPPTGPDGGVVVDGFPFVHQTLTGDGGITARVSPPAGPEGRAAEPWAKAGVVIKESTEQGSPYAAAMITPGHGVRLQSDFTHDTAGGAVSRDRPHWLRLTRSGDEFTAYESADGSTWAKVGTARLAGLPDTAQAGLFVATPGESAVQRQFGSTSVGGRPSQVTAVFDHVSVDGGEGTWRQDNVGEPAGGGHQGPPDSSTEKDGTWTLSGSSDIAPHTPEVDITQRSLTGAQTGLIPLVALSVLFITAEYRRGMILTTLTASPRRGRVLAAKAVVLAAAAFVTGLVAAVLSFLLSEPELRDRMPNPLFYPDVSLTDGPVLRAVVGTAVLLAAVAVLSLAVGALLRNTAAAVTLIVVVLVLPVVLLSGLPIGTAQWVMKLTPLAGFAVQRTSPVYEHVDSVCLPETGCYPQGPWAGLSVLCVWAVVVLGLAVWRLRGRDA